MLVGKLISVFLVTAILNPICCCNAVQSADPATRDAQPACGAAGSHETQPPSHASSCESDEACPLKPEALPQDSQLAASKAPDKPAHPSFEPPWLQRDSSCGGIAFAERHARLSRAEADPVRPPTPLRLHQSHCLYLI